jgi:hypothetical protein
MALTARKEGKNELSDKIERAVDGSPDDFLNISQVAKEELGPIPWANLLEQLFNVDQLRVDPKSLAISKAIWGIGDHVVVTTNYDHVLEWSGRDVRSFDSASPSELGRFLRGQLPNPAVWHLHGEVTRLNQVIVTRADYEALYGENTSSRTRSAKPKRAMPRKSISRSGR